ncbi:DNA-binding MarR family transcriptional regulator [Tamaricihabitans halophyticus]|uniref:DNA-binding MarR family transcriptional regulator n=1 Tax=Tamaricihabitans halophyticus TaxID=1262583 RepID=A0A4V2STH6_9PSEU|nr:MarR family transcriptional regulator [Tamaricihabitans halophyticus]TCP50776.1 DNA-binding MarR family transcriptional regulator [Tamaricihabitans halophyticus]
MESVDEPGEELDFWSFVRLANDKLAKEHGFRYHLATEVVLTLNRVANIVTYDLEAAVHRPRGRSWSAFRLLFVTWLAGPLEPKRAAELTGMSRAAVSNLVKGLSSDGVLDRLPGTRDGRSVRLSLTDKGAAEMVELFRVHNEREQEWASALTDAEQRILLMLLDKLITNRAQFDVRGRN